MVQMKTRNLSKLTETKEFQELTNNYPITFYIKDGSLLLNNNNNIYIYIYCYMSDGYPEFTLFNIPSQTYSSDIRYLMAGMTGDIEDNVTETYSYYEKVHTKSIINEGISGEIKMEKYFLSHIEILKKYFPDLLDGKIEKYEKYFEPLIGGYIKMFDELKAFVEQQESICPRLA